MSKLSFNTAGLLMGLCVALFTPVASAGYHEGLAAVQKRDYITALREFKLLADQGNASAQYNLGVMHGNDEVGMRLDYKEAVKWFRLAADQGHARAQHNLGLLYAKGHGVPINAVAAYAIYNVAAVSKDLDASNSAIANRLKTSKTMSTDEIDAAQRLSGEMIGTGNFLKALDQYAKAR